MARLLTALILLLVPVTVVLAAGEGPATTTDYIPLKHADARQVAAMFGGDPGPLPAAVDPEPARRDFAAHVRDAALEAAKPAPELMREAGLYVFAPRATAEVLLPPPGYRLFPDRKPEPTGKGLSALLPHGLTQGPVAFVDDNSLIVRGDPQAIDEFREIIALLDKPVKRVRLSVRLVTLAAKADTGLHTAAVVPGEPALGEGEDGPTGSVAVPSNGFAVLRTGLAVPFVVAPGEGQAGGYRTDAAVDTGELVVMPRVNADSSVSLFIGATDQIAEWLTRPAAPADAKPKPPPPGACLTRIENGGTAILAGLPGVQELLPKGPDPVHEAEPGASANPQTLLLITAQVLPPDDAQAALP